MKNILKVTTIGELSSFLLTLDSDENFYRNRMKKRVIQKVKEFFPEWKESEAKVPAFEVGMDKEMMEMSQFVDLTASYCSACVDANEFASDEIFSIILKAVEEMEIEYERVKQLSYEENVKFYIMINQLVYYIVTDLYDSEIYKKLVEKICVLKETVGKYLATQFGDPIFWQYDGDLACSECEEKYEAIKKFGYFRNCFGVKVFNPQEDYWGDVYEYEECLDN